MTYIVLIEGKESEMKKHTFYSLIIFVSCGYCALADSYQAILLPSDGYEQTTAAALSSGTTAGSAVFTKSPPSIVMLSRRNALVWQTPASSPQNIHPAEFYGSYINASYGQTLGGAVTIADTQESQFPPYTRTFQYNQAAIWTGPEHDFINLHPAGYDQSVVTACWGNQQAGSVQTNSAANPLFLSVSNAALWSGTAESVMDLHLLLPEIYVSSSASDIDAFGNIVGTATLADGTSQAVIWQPIPEPAAVLLLAVGTCFLKRRKHRNSTPSQWSKQSRDQSSKTVTWRGF